MSGLVDLRENNCRHRKKDVDNCASEDRPNLTRRWDAKAERYFCASPKPIPRLIHHLMGQPAPPFTEIIGWPMHHRHHEGKDTQGWQNLAYL